MKDSVPMLRRIIGELQAEIARLKARPVEVVERIVTPEPVVQEVVREVERAVYVKGDPVVTIHYVDNPAHLETIKILQEKLCQSISQ